MTQLFSPHQVVCPIACRKMWAEVLLAVIDDGAHEIRIARRRNAPIEYVERRLRAYLLSRDCAHIAMLAGLDLDDHQRAELLLAACRRLSFGKPRVSASAK